jgi:hypothetical protein
LVLARPRFIYPIQAFLILSRAGYREKPLFFVFRKYFHLLSGIWWSKSLRVVRFRHLAPIAPYPQPNVGIAKTTRNDKFLVAFLNVTFARRDCRIGDTNVKFTPRARHNRGFFAVPTSVKTPSPRVTHRL